MQPDTERTDQGEQYLAPVVAPITDQQRLAARWQSPMKPRKPQRPCDVGLFDEDAQKQEHLKW